MSVKKYLKVKYCQSEEELNEFLKMLPMEEYLDGKHFSQLARITYLPKQNSSGDSDNFEISTSLVAVVEYWSLNNEELL